jgi:hypothetical protein
MKARQLTRFAAVMGTLFVLLAALFSQTAGAAGDTTNPTLTSVTRTTATPVAAPGTVSVSYVASDDSSGVGTVRGLYQTPTGGTLVSPATTTATGSLTFTLSASAAPGTYLLAAIQVADKANPVNNVIYRRDGKITHMSGDSTGPTTHSIAFAPADFTVTNSNADTTNPVLVSFNRTSPASMTAPGSATLAYTASDAGTGVKDVAGVYATPSGKTIVAPFNNSASGTLTFNLSSTAEVGKYSLAAISVRDKANPSNSVIYRRNGSINKVTPDSAGPNTHTLDFTTADFTVTSVTTSTTAAPATTTSTTVGATTTSTAGATTTSTTAAGGTTTSTTAAGGTTTSTTAAGGSTTSTTAAGGSTTSTTAAGGSTTSTTAAGGTTTSTTAAGGTSSSTSSTTAPSSNLSLTASSVTAGNTVNVSGNGFKPGTPVDLSLHSTVVELGSAVVDANGHFSKTVVIPASTEAGPHTITAAGVAADGSARNLSISITVVAPTHLPVSGSNTKRDASIALALIAFGLFAVGTRLQLDRPLA